MKLNKNKKGFSLAETLLFLVITGVLTALTLPIINNRFANTDKLVYTAAYKTVEQVLVELKQDPAFLGVLTNTAGTRLLCNKFLEYLNTLGATDCTTSTDPGTPNFVTNNGMRWYDFEDDFAAGNLTIKVDINGQKNGKNVDGKDILKITISNNFSIVVPAADPEKTYIQEYLNSKY